MNKPVAFICACITALGLLILARSVYCTIVYGHGDPEAGNFHRCTYSVEHDLSTGTVRRDWEPRWDLVASTEGNVLAQILDMWVVGFGLVAGGVGVYLLELKVGRR